MVGAKHIPIVPPPLPQTADSLIEAAGRERPAVMSACWSVFLDETMERSWQGYDNMMCASWCTSRECASVDATHNGRASFVFFLSCCSGAGHRLHAEKRPLHRDKP